MAYSGLYAFIRALTERDEITIIRKQVNPELEITEITDRITKSGGKALLFEDTGTQFPLLINAYGSDTRMAMAMSRPDLGDAGRQIESLFRNLTSPGKSFLSKINSLPELIRLAGYMPSRKQGRGTCQQVIHRDPDISILPVLKCWPHDGGRYITLPIVHTVHPETGKPNAGMYRMQVLDGKTTAMHWQRHKTGASHFEEYRKAGKRMPVSVALGGDPVYAYSATAPLPEGIDEYILAGFLRKKRVKLVRCLTNDLWVPEDADIIIEGYVDPSEEMFWEGPFGDHTGFYSLADWYPLFHITCITHSQKAVYPATIVGVPPMEDAWIAKATEKIFLSPVRMTLQPEIEDFHMPDAGVAHNLVIVRINKSYPGQGMKVLSSLSGAGQMMFSKYLIVVSGDVDIRNYGELASHIFKHTDLSRDLLFSHGPLDVLDHASDAFSFGGKLGVDATVKLPEESLGRKAFHVTASADFDSPRFDYLRMAPIQGYSTVLMNQGIPILIVTTDRTVDAAAPARVAELFRDKDTDGLFRVVILLDHTADPSDIYLAAWQLLGNSDPERDHIFLSHAAVLLDGTVKLFRKGGFPRKWPNVVCSDPATISLVDALWESLDLGPFISSPSQKYSRLLRKGKDEIVSE